MITIFDGNRLYTDFVQARMDEGYRKKFHAGVFESRILVPYS